MKMSSYPFRYHRCRLTHLGIAIFKMKQSCDHLMGIPIRGKDSFILRQGPGGLDPP